MAAFVLYSFRLVSLQARISIACLAFINLIFMDINQRLQIQLTAPDDEGCAARNMLNLQKKTLE